MTYQPVSLQELLVHQGWALQVARRLVREEGEAEDLVQRTWVAALRSPPSTARGARAWIRKVILNLARERHRRALVRERHERSSAVEASAPDAFESLSQREIHRLLGEHLLALSEPYRSVVLLRYYDGLSSAEIARRMGIPAGTVRWRLKIGLDQLRTDLDRQCHGDRTRWVSALLLFLPPDFRPTDFPPSDARRPGEPDSRSLPAGSAPGLAPAPALGWLALAALGLLGLTFVVRGSVRGIAAAAPVPIESASASRPSGDARDAREPRVPSAGPAVAEAATPEPAEPSGLRVLVVDEQGTPYAGAHILVARATGFEERATSDAHGLARVAPEPGDIGALGLPATAGRLALRALVEGRVASPLVHVAAPFTPEHEVRLVVGGPEDRLSGRILDQDGAGLPGALVAWFHPLDTVESLTGDFTSPSYLTTVTDADGNFTLRNLAPGRGQLGCLAKGYVLYSTALDTRTARTPILVRLGPGATVCGVVRQADGRPAPGVRVFCEPLLKAAEWATGLPGYQLDWRGFGETTTSDENGAYRLTGVTSRLPRKLWALDPAGGRAATLDVTLESRREMRWNPVLEERPGYRLRLVDERGQPLPGWVVQLRRPLTPELWWQRRLAADAEGCVRIADCPPGEGFLDVFTPDDVGASYAWRRIQPSLEEQRIEVVTRASSTLCGRLLDESGQPELRGQLTLHSLQTAIVTRIGRDAQGNFDQRTVPGNYVLVLQIEQSATRLSTFTLTEGEREMLGTFTTPPMGFLRINAAALASRSDPAYTLFRLSDDARVRGVLEVGNGSLGEEVLLPVFPGRYRVLAFDGLSAKPSSHDVVVASHAETRLDLGR